MHKSLTPGQHSRQYWPLLALAGLSCLTACKSVDRGEPARLAAERARQLQTTEAYQAFLNTRPDRTLYAEDIARARATIDEETRAHVMGLDLAGQVDYLRNSSNKLAREEVLTAVIARMDGLSRVEQIQWMYDLAWPCKDAGVENAEAMLRILAPPDRFVSERDIPKTGPARMDSIARSYLAGAIGGLRHPSADARQTGFGYLLAISTDRADLRLTTSNQRWVPADQGTPTSPRAIAMNALEKVPGAFGVARTSLEKGTLAGDRAWSVVEEWLLPGSNFEHKSSLFVALMRSEERDIGEQFLPLAEAMTGGLRLPALLECVRRRVPHVNERIEAWLVGDDPAEQTAAAYALALFDLDLAPFEERIEQLLRSERRDVRSAAALARYGLAPPTSAASAMAADLGGTASIDRFLQQVDRGFVMGANTSFVDLTAPLPDLDFSDESPLRTTIHMPYRGRRYTRSESLAELGKVYPLLRRARDPRAAALRHREARKGDPGDSVIRAVTILAVLEREPELFMEDDPREAETKQHWLIWPDLYLCYLDPVTDVVLGTYSGHWGSRLLPVPSDVDRAVRRVFETTGIHGQFPGVEGGVVAVHTPGHLQKVGSHARQQMKGAKAQLVSTVAPFNGRRLSATETEWGYVLRSPVGRSTMSVYGTAHPVQLMARGRNDANFDSDLVFSQSTGRVTGIVDVPTGKPETVGLQVAIEGHEGETLIKGLSVLGIEVGATVSRGQWIGMRWHRNE